jgi:hypothetical protein
MLADARAKLLHLGDQVVRRHGLEILVHDASDVLLQHVGGAHVEVIRIGAAGPELEHGEENRRNSQRPTPNSQ